MSKVAKFFSRPGVNLALVVASGLVTFASSFTSLDDPYGVTPIAFLSFALILGRLAVTEHLAAERLRSEARPKLELVFHTGQLYDSLHSDGTLRIFRVGVRNSGATVNDVAVKVARVLPELPRVFPMQEFQQTHEKEGTSRFAVNKSDEPFVFADLIGQKIFAEDGQVTGTKDGKPYTQHHKKGSTAQMWFEFAQGGREIPLDKESYLIWLALDAPGAKGTRKFKLLRLNDGGQYDLSEVIA